MKPRFPEIGWTFIVVVCLFLFLVVSCLEIAERMKPALFLLYYKAYLGHDQCEYECSDPNEN